MNFKDYVALQEQLLLELSERLKRHDAYGSWIDTNTMEIHDVPKMGGHIDYIRERLKEWDIPYRYVRRDDDYYTVGFSKGLVRTVYQPKSVLTVDGLGRDLGKIVPIIMASAAQPDLDIVRINKVVQLGDPATNMKSFEVPGQRHELQVFLRS